MALMKDKKIVVSVMQYMSEVTNPIRVCCSNKRAVKFSQNSKYKEHKTLQNPNVRFSFWNCNQAVLFEVTNKLFLCLKIWKPISMVQQGYNSSGTGHTIQQ